ncbi:MAG: septal ring lytic transglycosylase RlpA family protein [Cyanobium sp.]|jgi:rare lipoprotein A|nr:septal ring lytic transglycosylase RlpA family protein [Synechococcaceae cyanobacterium]
MRASRFLGAVALLITGTSVAPALAAPSERPSQQASPVALRQVGEPPSFEDTLLRQAPPMTIAQTLIASSSTGRVISGQASWYGPGFYGNRTASGEVFSRGTLTAAHRTLPFGTLVRVTNLNNGRSTVVRINDRGPFHSGRILDLAHGAASRLGVVASGTAQVSLEVLD